MKIGILTHWWAKDNYGQALQMYGLYNYLLWLDHSPCIIRFNPFMVVPQKRRNINRALNVFNPMKLHRFLKDKIIKNREDTLQKNNPRDFPTFLNKYFTFTDRSFSNLLELAEAFQDYDAIIVGSDQVWNYFPSGEDGYSSIDAYTIRFGPTNLIRLSYAASMGFSGISKIHGNRLASNLKFFSGISVREKQAVDILKNFGVSEVFWVPDPTMLLGPEGYSKLISNDDKYKTAFFVYSLKNTSVFVGKEIAKELSVKRKIFEYVGGNGLGDKELTCFPTIEEWLSYMYGAETIITNSFHGCVFSILFQKNFYYYPLLPNKDGHVDTRIDSLLGRLGIEGRAITSKEQLSTVIANPYKPIDWDSVDAKREEFVQVGKDFLAKHLGDSSI